MNHNRTIMHVDMNAFFASIEQHENPGLRNKPIAVVGSGHRTVVTTASYEARRFGVKTGMNRYEAKKVCKELIFVVGDNRKYIGASMRVMDILSGFSPVVEPYSIDEAFVDMTGTEALLGEAEHAAKEIKRKIKDAIGIRCSIGIAPNKLLAKLASDMQKPDGLVVIKRSDVGKVLEDMPVGKLCGIGPSLTSQLEGLGIRTCGALGRFPEGILKRRFGIIGTRLKLMGQGIDEGVVVPVDPEVKSIGHSHTLPSDISDKSAVKWHIFKLSSMVAKRARRHGLMGSAVQLTLRYSDFNTFTRRARLSMPSNDERVITAAASAMLDSIRLAMAVRLVGVTVSGVAKDEGQLELFQGGGKRHKALEAMDSINEAFGSSTLTWAVLNDDKLESNVISPAWRPTGARMIDCR
ncbi:MAG: DNA polymerase IV [Deltaproteobacteria bacterium]|nr:DNA polymerase IV [Deltaproteobacteria bacterium]